MREIFLRKYKQSFSLAQTVYAYQFQCSDEFKYLTSETGHINNKKTGMRRREHVLPGQSEPAARSARAWSGSGKVVGPCPRLIPAQPAQAATRR